MKKAAKKVAKKSAAKAATKDMELSFPRTGIPWIDAGTAGLFRVLTSKTSYLVDSLLKDKLQAAIAGVKVEFDLDGALRLVGPKDQVQQLLELAYEDLTDCYFNVSSEKQRAERKAYNFYFVTDEERFQVFPKSRAAGPALLLFDKASRPTGTQKKWGTDSESGKEKAGVLPEGMEEHQSKLDLLVAEYGLKPGPPAGLLIDGPNKVQPKIKIRVGLKEQPCDFLTGLDAGGLDVGKATAFPLFGGSRSFASNTTDEPRVGWQMDYVGKFTPAVTFYYMQNDDMYLFFPQSSDLRRIVDVSEELVGMRQVQANFFKNFELQLGGYFAERSEILLAFLHAVFRHFSGYRPAMPIAVSDNESEDGDDELVSLGPVDAEEEEADVEHISCQQVFDKLCRGAPVNFAVVAARKMGNLWMGRDFQTFTDVLYIARLFDLMTSVVLRENGPQRERCSPKRLMATLLDFTSKKNKSSLRNKVCERILTKQSVLSLLEQHAYHKFSQWKPGEPLMISVLRDFALLYEPEICEVHGMTKTEFEQMAQSAKWLGEKIADAVAGFTDGESNERGESVGRSKGVFFRLRRARKLEDFQEEIIRIQMRYKVDIPAHALDADRFNPETFAQFKGFCVIAALSRFEYRQKSKKSSPAAAT